MKKVFFAWVAALIALAFVLRFDDTAQQACEANHSQQVCENILKQ